MNWKINKLSLLRLLLTVLASVVPAQARAAEKPASRQAEFTLQIPVKDAFIVREGGSTEPSSKVSKGKIGMNEITVSAPGYSVRKIRFWLKAGDKKTIAVNLSKVQQTIEPEWKSLDKVLPASKVGKIPSICVWYQDKTNDSNVCRRQTLLEDVSFAEPSAYAVDDMRALSSAKSLSLYRELVNRSLSQDVEVEARVEELFRLFPDNPSVFQLASSVALQAGDCPRVHTIFVDAQQVMENTYPLVLYKSICMEMQGQTELAVMLLQENLKDNKSPAPYLSYHLGRLLMKKSPDLALELANVCVKSFRFDMSCQELGLMSARLAQKVYKVQRFNLEEGTFKTFRNLEEGLPKGQAEALFFSVIPLVNTYPQSLEFYLFLSWIDSVQKIPGGLDYYSRKMQVGSILAGGSLDTLIDGLEKQNLTQLLPPLYRSRLRGNSQDPNLWLRLIRAHSKAGQCAEVLKAVQDGAQILPKYNAQLLQMEASCYVEMNRLNEALDAYLKVLTAQPKVWSTYYNLATVYEKLKQRKEALENYQRSLQFNPPADLRDSINAKILELQALTPAGKMKKSK